MITTRDMIIMLCVALVTSVVAISIRGTTHTSVQSKATPLVQEQALQFDAIQYISIHRNGITLKFEQKNREWWQAEPFVMRMHSPSMIALITTVQSVQHIGQVSTDANIDTIGLGDSANAIVLSDGSHAIEILLGRKTLGGRAYARVDGSTPVLVDQSLHRRAIDMDYKLWRDARLFPDFAIDGVRIDRILNGDRLLLDRSSGRWEMLQPVTARVDQNILLEWVGRLAAARIGSFIQDEPEDLALFGLHNPLATIAVEDGKGTAHTLLIGGRVSAGSKDRYVMLVGRPVVFSMKWDSISKLFPASEIFVDATGSAVSRFDVKRIVIRMHGSEYEFERKLESWVNVQNKFNATEDVNTLLAWLLETKPPQVSIGAYPRADEVATVTFIGYDLSPLDTVRIAQDIEGGVILENGDNVLRLHPADSIEVLQKFIE